MSGMKIIEGLQEAVAHSRGDLSLRGIIEAIINVDSQEPTDYRRLAGRIAARMSGEIDHLTRDLAEARAERDAARAVLRGCEWVGRSDGVKNCPVCCRRFQRDGGHAPDCVLAAALGSVTLPATPIASGHAGEREELLCSDCPFYGYPTDETRCAPCPRRGHPNAGSACAALGTGSAPAEPAADRDGGGGE